MKKTPIILLSILLLSVSLTSGKVKEKEKTKRVCRLDSFLLLGTTLDTVDLNNLNNNSDKADYLPSTGGGLYRDFIKWGLIKPIRDLKNQGPFFRVHTFGKIVI